MSEQENAPEAKQFEVVETKETLDVVEKPKIEDVKGLLSDKEMEMAQRLGVVDDIKKEVGETKGEIKATETKEDITEQADKDLSAEDEHQYTAKLTTKERGFYFKTKEEKQKRQRAEAERDLLQIQIKHLQADKSDKKEVPGQQPSKDEALLKLESELSSLTDKGDDDLLTVAELRRIRELDKQISTYTETKKIKEQEEKRVKTEEFIKSHNAKIATLEAKAVEKYPDWEEKSKLAQEVIKADETGAFAARLYELVLSDDPEKNAKSIDYVMQLAKRNTEYGKVEDKKANEKVEKIEKNLNKKPSSAALGSGGARMVSEDDLTPEDVVNWSVEKYQKLKPETKRRLKSL